MEKTKSPAIKKTAPVASEETKPVEKKPELIPLEKITTLRFVDESDQVYGLDARWGGEYVLRPRTKE